MRAFNAWLYRLISERYMHGCSNYNTLEVRRGCRSKAQSRTVFERNGVPHAQGMTFLLPGKAKQFARQHGFPVVIKPNVSGYSRGSYFPINQFSELMHGIVWSKLWWPITIIEQYLAGANYRVLSTNHNLISVIRRYPPFVTGNGTDSVATLIDCENEIRARMNTHMTIYQIRKNKLVRQHLKKQNLTFDSIPAKGQYVELFFRVALATGGIVETIAEDTIAPDNKKLFIDIVSMFDANVLGIDVIFEKGIEISYQKQKCIFIEVNSRPYTKMHHAPRYGKVEDLSKYYAELEKLDIPDKDLF